jgi:hypothetical protein
MVDELFGCLINEACLGSLGWYLLPVILIATGIWLIISGTNLWLGLGCTVAGLCIGLLLYRNRTTGDDL